MMNGASIMRRKIFSAIIVMILIYEKRDNINGFGNVNIILANINFNVFVNRKCS